MGREREAGAKCTFIYSSPERVSTPESFETILRPCELCAVCSFWSAQEEEECVLPSRSSLPPCPSRSPPPLSLFHSFPSFIHRSAFGLSVPSHQSAAPYNLKTGWCWWCWGVGGPGGGRHFNSTAGSFFLCLAATASGADPSGKRSPPPCFYTAHIGVSVCECV